MSDLFLRNKSTLWSNILNLLVGYGMHEKNKFVGYGMHEKNKFVDEFNFFY